MSSDPAQPRRDAQGALIITVPARLASGAMQNREHAQVLIYAAARALDVRGSGRILVQDVASELRWFYSCRHVERWAEHPKARRYWRLDRQFLALNGVSTVLDSFGCDLPENDLAVSAPMSILDLPRRRNAFLLAAVMAGSPRNLSRDYVTRFARVDRKTLSQWKRDPVLWDQILKWEQRWSTKA